MEEGKGFNFGIGKIITILVLVGLVGGAFSLYGYINTLRDQRVDWETQLPNQYSANQSYLSAYMGGFYEQVGVAKLKSDKMDKILLDAVKGRYEGAGGFKSSKEALFSAIKEAYPDLSGLNIFDKMMDYIASKREGYRADQAKLLDMLRGYDKWRQSGILQSWIIKHILDCPSENMIARVGEKKFTGQAALDQMYLIVLVEGTTEAYTTGKMKPLEVK